MQLHKRQTIDQIKLVLDWYSQGLLSRDEALAKLELKRRRFYVLLSNYRDGKLGKLKPPLRTNAHRKIDPKLETVIRIELENEKRLIANPAMPVKTYNYAAITDRVTEQTGLRVSAQTIRNRAKTWGFYLEKRQPKTRHTRVVLTTATGLLLQHDASHHLWSPFADSKWVLITTLDDYSRMLVYADFWSEETTWAHIMALKSVVTTYGVGSNYYTDNHSIFRFIERQESYWKTPKRAASDIKTQWERAVKECGMGTIYAMSPEAKGKIERPYRWLQDRIVRACAKAGVTDIAGGRDILKAEVDRYNTKQVHSTTKEIPLIRFQRAEREGNTVFRKFILPEPYTSDKDVFCLKETRVVNGYGHFMWRGQPKELPSRIPEGAIVRLHIVPDSPRPELRVWYKDELVQSISLAPHQSSIQGQN
jgi:transposase